MQLSVTLETFSLKLAGFATLLCFLTTMKEIRVLTLAIIRAKRYAVDQGAISLLYVSFRHYSLSIGSLLYFVA
jgi:hypothetical protein